MRRYTAAERTLHAAASAWLRGGLAKAYRSWAASTAAWERQAGMSARADARWRTWRKVVALRRLRSDDFRVRKRFRAVAQRWRLRHNQRGKAGDVVPESELADLVEDVTLEPGDVLFVPRAMYHRTSTLVTSRKHSSPQPSLHITFGVETDTDGFTWSALLTDAGTAMALPEAKDILERAQWRDERLREALPLALCRYGASLARSEPHAGEWLNHARELIMEHLHARVDASQLRRVLDAALMAKQQFVEDKRQQLLKFISLSPDLQL